VTRNGEALISLGPSGPRVAPLGVGTWQWGDRLLWGYGRGYGAAELHGAYAAARAGGVALFDTAEIYGLGRSERLLGRFMRTGGPGRAVVATKFMPFPWRLRRADLRRALRGSLQRLGLRRVDLYQVHWPAPPVAIETWMEALADAVDAGLVGAVGVSNFSARQTRRAAEALARRGVALASNQVEYSLLRRGIERDGTLETCRALGVTVIAYSPLAMGLLSGKYDEAHPPPGLRRRLAARRYPARIDPLIGLLRELGRAHGDRTPAQVALNWLICKGALPIPGAKNARQARDNAGALGWRLADDEVAALDRVSARSRGAFSGAMDGRALDVDSV
jgi:aryl-alcohol dehydrogenase-like predicted oxidoreductase